MRLMTTAAIVTMTSCNLGSIKLIIKEIFSYFDTYLFCFTCTFQIHRLREEFSAGTHNYCKFVFVIVLLNYCIVL